VTVGILKKTPTAPYLHRFVFLKRPVSTLMMQAASFDHFQKEVKSRFQKIERRSLRR